MLLIGQYDSPFVRRVAVTMTHYGIAFERDVLSVFGNFEDVLKFNPLGRVPALRLDDGEMIVDSQMILDHLDLEVGPERALTPPDGAARRAVLRRTTVALGAVEKAIALRGELYRRREGSQDDSIVARLRTQIASALSWLEKQVASPWFETDMRQDDIASAVVVTFLMKKPPYLLDPTSYPRLAMLAATAEALSAFRAAPFEAD
tara:strand:- start:283 stop:894 length:612 start_codon:yes stop_codon:yes gene_type:complete